MWKNWRAHLPAINSHSPEPARNARRLALFLLLFLILTASQARSQTGALSFMPYPSADSTVINPYTANDETALLLEIIKPSYLRHTGHNLRVVHIPGRGGATGWGELVSRLEDGYTLAATNLENVLLRSMTNRPVFTAGDLYQVCILAEAPLVLWVPMNSPFASIGDLLRSAKAYSGRIVLAGAGSSTITHLSSLRFDFLIGSRTIYLPFMGTSTAMQATAAGHAHAAWGYPLTGFGQKMNMRPLAVAARSRLPQLPETPTFDELGIGLFETCHFGLAIPGESSPNTRQQVSSVYQSIGGSPDFQDDLRAHGFTPGNMNTEELNELIQETDDRFRELLPDFSME
ncbi:MAG: tripartite tricarboxylate transporter substrate-binding protein [Desulfovibrionaceae bacterium]|nr:tripartite tricarboxylate transporter substrate-binding protein [Desulfovibrionaceae bacterium]